MTRRALVVADEPAHAYRPVVPIATVALAAHIAIAMTTAGTIVMTAAGAIGCTRKSVSLRPNLYAERALREDLSQDGRDNQTLNHVPAAVRKAPERSGLARQPQATAMPAPMIGSGANRPAGTAGSHALVITTTSSGAGRQQAPADQKPQPSSPAQPTARPIALPSLVAAALIALIRWGPRLMRRL